MRRLAAAGLCVGALLSACGGRDRDPQVAAFGEVQPTQVGRYLVGVSFEPDPPPLGELFTATATVSLPDGTPLETGVVTLDARMPQHDHGMETRPRVRTVDCVEGEVCRHPNGIYVADGFKFHMSGAWTVLATVTGPRGPDSTSFVYEMR